MNHSIEVEVYTLNNPNDEIYVEIPLEVTFDIYGSQTEITGYFIDGKTVKLNEFYDLNPSLDRRIERKIDHYILNYEPSFMNCE